MVDRNSRREKDLDLIKEHWEKEETVSLKDRNLKELERLAIVKWLEKLEGKALADIGCGDASDTLYYCDYIEDVWGFDYSKSMLRKAKEITKGKVKLARFDIIKEDLENKFDIITTKRCLINLGNFNNQKNSIQKIHDSLNPGGYYIMLECSMDGLLNLNTMRQQLNLEHISEPFHDVYFDMNNLTQFLKNLFHVESLETFSTYYFLTRIYNHLLDIDEKKLHEYDSIAKKMHQNLSVFGSHILGPQFLYVLRKKSGGAP